MAIDGEPKNGDFARYIEELSRTGGAPGQVLPAQRAPAAAAQSGVAGKLSELTWGKRPERTAPAPLPASGAELPAAREHLDPGAGVLPAGSVCRPAGARPGRRAAHAGLAGGRGPDTRLVAPVLEHPGKQLSRPGAVRPIHTA
ncbi:hypothetical protein L550_2337 [Bordetella pertussis H973]|uniref:Uncharacterized protein n=1 Tax=Bordetella pertussis CHLA-26 TaxID=1331284 RepID=A0AAI9J554_BORPT|nr:hypothetical protein V483_1473 [Bordetella pertussis CHLA-11]ETG99178.1 hypothetical protein L569_1485 [Bordetella pertussis 2250905]ETH03369.1 hypothetical protein L570_1400 [Bordetella pertussis 2356847]ETH07854.1 hypothetical protein L571_1416 [Bordetella pertussis 2371640]ETH12810.1 hypothetical protein L574_1835 [Bordetella pertussis STO1-SEAT-0006]ETH15222.1 hypothetical protein L575_2824 [Bordetella pertussis STO1-SEAT-0007]ETH20772.1 hypothetical protein L563_1328 [Bordetella pertu